MSLRLFWRRLHSWAGVICGLFLLAMAVSGLALMFSAKIDRWLQPSLYAVTGATVAQAPDVYLANGKSAVPNGEAFQLRWPQQDGMPVIVLVRLNEGGNRQGAEPANAPEHRASRQGGGHQEGSREQGSERRADRDMSERGGAAQAGGRPKTLAVYLDPPTGNVLGTADTRGTVIGLIHLLHSDLLVPAFGGGSIVGWVGVTLFFLCLTGFYLWWPRSGSLLRALRWRRSPATAVNLHHSAGFWIVLPLAVMALTGIFQAFQQPGRAFMSFFAPVSQQQMGQGAGAQLLRQPQLTPQGAIDAGLSTIAGARPTLLALPMEANKSWRLQIVDASGDGHAVLIDDVTKAVSSPRVLRGDAILSFMRRIHEGYHDGPIWETIVILCALALPLLFVTGVMMWLRRRRLAAAALKARPAAMEAAGRAAPVLNRDQAA